MTRKLAETGVEQGPCSACMHSTASTDHVSSIIFIPKLLPPSAASEVPSQVHTTHPLLRTHHPRKPQIWRVKPVPRHCFLQWQLHGPRPITMSPKRTIGLMPPQATTKMTTTTMTTSPMPLSRTFPPPPPEQEPQPRPAQRHHRPRPANRAVRNGSRTP